MKNSGEITDDSFNEAMGWFKTQADSLAYLKVKQDIATRDSLAIVEREKQDSIARAEREKQESIARAEREKQESIARAEREKQNIKNAKICELKQDISRMQRELYGENYPKVLESKKGSVCLSTVGAVGGGALAINRITHNMAGIDMCINRKFPKFAEKHAVDRCGVRYITGYKGWGVLSTEGDKEWNILHKYYYGHSSSPFKNITNKGLAVTGIFGVVAAAVTGVAIYLATNAIANKKNKKNEQIKAQCEQQNPELYQALQYAEQKLAELENS